MMITGLLIPILLVAALAYVFGWRPGQMTASGPAGNRQTPVDVVKERYARGEITREQYEQMRKDLE